MVYEKYLHKKYGFYKYSIIVCIKQLVTFLFISLWLHCGLSRLSILTALSTGKNSGLPHCSPRKKSISFCTAQISLNIKMVYFKCCRSLIFFQKKFGTSKHVNISFCFDRWEPGRRCVNSVERGCQVPAYSVSVFAKTFFTFQTSW